MVTRKVLLEFNALFPEEDYKEYCSKICEIPKRLLYDFASTYLRFKINDERIANIQTFLGMWFRKENHKYANELNQRITSIEKDKGYKILIINEITNLLIFEAGLKAEEETLKINEPELEILFFKIYIAFNQKSTENENLAGETTKDLDFPHRINALLLAQTLSYGDITNYNLKESFIIQSTKAIFFFEFITSHIEFEDHIKLFYNHYNITDYKEFIKEFLGLLVLILKAKDEGKIDINIPSGEDYRRRILFFDEIAITKTYEDIDVDFKLVRNFPLVKIEERKYRIIFPLFTIEKLYNGLYFKFKTLNNAMPKEKKIKDIRAELTFRFSEKHLLYELLRRCYNNKFIQKTGEEISGAVIDGFVDYYLRNGNKVFLFESKDILFNAEVKQSHDYTRIEQELKKKLYYEEKGEKIDRKAILQLIESIKTLMNGKFICDSKFKPNSIRIYPIIVLHNKQLETLGVNQILRHWWRTEVKKLEREPNSIYNIKDVVVLNIDTLALHSDNIKSNKIRLENIIDSYLKDTNQNMLLKKKFRTEDARNGAFQDSCLPFSDYIGSKSLWKLPSIFEEKGLTLFQEDKI